MEGGWERSMLFWGWRVGEQLKRRRRTEERFIRLCEAGREGGRDGNEFELSRRDGFSERCRERVRERARKKAEWY